MTKRPHSADDLTDLPTAVNEDVLELIRGEYEDLKTARRSNEELGERRLDVFLTLIAAVTAAIGLASSRFEGDQTTLLAISLVAASLLLIFGLMTLRRVMVRNDTTTQYLNGLRRIGAFFLQDQPQASTLLPFPPKKESIPRKRSSLSLPKESPTNRKQTSWWTLGTAGLLETAAAINCGLTGLIAAAAAWLLDAAIIISLLVAVVAGLAAWIAQMHWADKTYEKLERKAKTDRQEVLDYWAGRTRLRSSNQDPQFFRAGVGMAIVDEQGRVLAFERSDVPGSWQLPQGGLNPGEDAEAAAWRELREETGLRPEHLTLERETDVWIGYELPEHLRSSKTGRGQAHRWFVFKVEPRAGLPPLPTGQAGEFRDRQWMTVEELLDGVVDFRRPVYEVVARWVLRPPPTGV